MRGVVDVVVSYSLSKNQHTRDGCAKKSGFDKSESLSKLWKFYIIMRVS